MAVDSFYVHGVCSNNETFISCCAKLSSMKCTVGILLVWSDRPATTCHTFIIADKQMCVSATKKFTWTHFFVPAISQVLCKHFRDAVYKISWLKSVWYSLVLFLNLGQFFFHYIFYIVAHCLHSNSPIWRCVVGGANYCALCVMRLDHFNTLQPYRPSCPN